MKPGKMILNSRLEPYLGGPNKDPKNNQVRIPFSESSTSRHGPPDKHENRNGTTRMEFLGESGKRDGEECAGDVGIS